MASGPFRCIGLTGGICSGKSSILAYLSSLGAGIVETDKIAHQLYQPGTEVHRQVLEAFPALVPPSSHGNSATLEIDRKVLGDIVFRDPSQRLVLNSIVWPAVRLSVVEAIQRHRDAGLRAAVVESAMMLEAYNGRPPFADAVWVACVKPENAIIRMQERNQLTVEQAQKRLASQWTNEQRIAYADEVIWTDGPIETTRTYIRAAWDRLFATTTSSS